MPKWNRTREDENHLKRRIQLVRQGFNHDQIDQQFSNEKEENLTLAQVREKERQLELGFEELENQKKLFETYVQETSLTLDNLEAQIKTKKQIIDETNLNVSLRKLNFFMKEAQKDFEDSTLVCFLYLENGKWVTKYFPIKENQQTVILECCDKLRIQALEEQEKKKGDS
ncbi:MAG: hypothetical protein ABSB89_10830 [Candidatus Bathyarchaeia archaeon]|jgi:hypothetical protein